jgi:Flp pilus assembly pilin Flp
VGKILRLSARDVNGSALAEYTILTALIAVLMISTMKLVDAAVLDEWQYFSVAVEDTQGVQPF